MAVVVHGWLVHAARQVAFVSGRTAVVCASRNVGKEGDAWSEIYGEGQGGVRRCKKGCIGRCGCCSTTTPSVVVGGTQEVERGAMTTTTAKGGRDMLQFSGARENTVELRGVPLGSEDFEMCAVPKRRVSHRRKGLRSGGKRLELSRAAPKVLIRCAVCGGLRLPHHVCRACVKALTKNTAPSATEQAAG